MNVPATPTFNYRWDILRWQTSRKNPRTRPRRQGHCCRSSATWRQGTRYRREQPQKEVLQALVRDNVEAGSNLYSDALKSYDGLAGEFTHQVIDHAGAYVNE